MHCESLLFKQTRKFSNIYSCIIAMLSTVDVCQKTTIKCEGKLEVYFGYISDIEK